MRNKILLHFILLSFFYLNIENVFALQITQVDNTQTSGGNPSSSQFVEIYNYTDENLDISGYRLFDSGASKSGHGISSTNTENNFLIPPKTYFILATTNTIKSIFAGCRVFKYPIAISSNDNVYFKKDDTLVSSFSANGINTLSSTSCSQNNFSSDNNNSTSTNSTSTTTENSSSNPSIVYVYVPTNNQNKYGDITVLLPEEKLLPAGADSEFDLKAIDKDKKVITGLDFEWSFGDGGEKFGQKVVHHYTYPGEYTLVASADGYSVGGEAKMNVKVVTPDITISKVGIGGNENFVDLTNNTDYDLVLSNFYLDIDNVYYKLPKNFTISKKGTVHVSGETVGFNLPATSVSLNYPNKNLLISFENKKLDLVSDSTTSPISIIKTEDKPLIYTQNIKEAEYIEEELPKVLPLNKEAKESFTLKRLIMGNENEKETILESKPTNLNKNLNVDTGIVNWLKSLLY